MNIFLDDERMPLAKDVSYVIFRTAESLMDFLKWNPNLLIGIMSLDHDLGAGMNGRKFLDWYEEQIFTGVFMFPEYVYIHSMNCSGAQAMRMAANNINDRRGGVR